MASKDTPKSPRESPKSPREAPKSPRSITTGPCAPLFQGYLSKKGGSKGGRRNWKKRYFVLTDNDLRYYENYQAFIAKPTAPKGAVPLRNYDKILDSAETSSEAHPFCFLLEAGERKLYMSSAARMSKGEWIDAIASIGEMHKFMVAKTERTSIMLGMVENGLIEISFKLLEKVSIVVSSVYAFIDEVNSKDPNVSNILTVIKDLGLSTCLSMRAFLRAIKFVGEYNLQACLLNADKIIGILRKLEEVTRSAVEKAAQNQKVSLITNMLGVKTLLSEDLKRVTNLAPRNRGQSTERAVPKKGKEKDPDVTSALSALSDMAFENTLQGGQNNPLYGHDSATNSPVVTRKKTLSLLIDLADQANSTLDSLENTLSMSRQQQLTNTPRSLTASPMASPRRFEDVHNVNGTNNTNVLPVAHASDNNTNNTNVQPEDHNGAQASNNSTERPHTDSTAEPVFTHNNEAYGLEGTLGPRASAALVPEPVAVTTPRTPREGDIKPADIESLKADIGLLSQFLTMGSPFEPNDDDPIEMLEEGVKRVNEDITHVDYDLTAPNNNVVEERRDDSSDDSEDRDSSSSDEVIDEQPVDDESDDESDDDALISVISPSTPRIVLPALVTEPKAPTAEEPDHEQPFRSGDLVLGEAYEVSHDPRTLAPSSPRPTQQQQPTEVSVAVTSHEPTSASSQSSQSSSDSSAPISSAPVIETGDQPSSQPSSSSALPRPIVETTYNGNSSPSSPRAPQIEIPKVRTSSLRSNGDRMPDVTFTAFTVSARRPSDISPSSSPAPPNVTVSLAVNGHNDQRTSEAEDPAPRQSTQNKSWRASVRFSTRASEVSKGMTLTLPPSYKTNGSISHNNNNTTDASTSNNNTSEVHHYKTAENQAPLRSPRVSDLSNRAMSKSSGYFISVVYINGLHRLNVDTHPMSPYLDILEEGRTDVFLSVHRGIYLAWMKGRAVETNGSGKVDTNNNNNHSDSSEPKHAAPESEKKEE